MFMVWNRAVIPDICPSVSGTSIFFINFSSSGRSVAFVDVCLYRERAGIRISFGPWPFTVSFVIVRNHHQ